MVATNPIKYLTIEGFKSIQRLEELELGQLNILIGPNGAGKSNFISYFHMLREMVEGRLQVWVGKQGGANRLLTYGVKETSKLFSHIKFGNNAYAFTLEPTVTDRFIFTDERLFYEDRYAQGLPIGGWGNSEAQLKSEIVPNEWRMANYCYASISNWKIFHFHDTSDTAGVKRQGGLQDNEYLRSDASNLAAYLYRLEQRYPTTYSQIRKIVQLAVPFFGDFVLIPEEVRPDEYQIQLMWRQNDSDYPFLPSQLSDGSIRFICLVTALSQPDPPSTIIIDEPELGLHPYAITLLGALMRSASASARMQIIVSTQSVPLLNEFSIDDLIVVERRGGVSVFNRLDESEFEMWLEDYSIGELWEKNVLGGRLPA